MAVSGTNVKRAFPVRLVRGDYGLVKTFWIGTILPGILVSSATRTLRDEIDRAEDLADLMTYMVMLVVLSTLGYSYGLACLVSIWNAATRHAGRRAWSISAKVFVICWVLVLGTLYGLSSLSLSLDSLP